MTVEDLLEKQTEELERQKSLENRILCCTAAGCVSCGADGLRSAIATEIKAQGREGKVEVCGTGCMGLCSKGPLVLSSADRHLYGNVTAADAPALRASASALLTTCCNSGIRVASTSEDMAEL